MSKKSTQVAIGGVFSALCLVLMFLTGLFPFSTYALPMLAGAMLVAVMIENGRGASVMVYITVSVLSLLIVPDREATLMFVAFFGYYPIVKELIERIPLRLAEYAVKLALFNAAVAGSYFAAVRLLGMTELTQGFGDFGRYSLLVFLGAGNLLFVVYDFALTRYLSAYLHWFKPRFLRR